MSLLGLLVYGAFHVESIAITKKIEWLAPADWSPEHLDYYAAQGNATRIFVGKKYRSQLTAWKSVKTISLSAVAYAGSGGYSSPQLYPTGMYSPRRAAGNEGRRRRAARCAAADRACPGRGAAAAG